MKSLGICLVVLFAFSISIWSQDKYLIQGYVYDQTGNPLPGASVLFHKINTVLNTDSTGFFSFTLKDKGEYFITVALPGFNLYQDTLYTSDTKVQYLKLQENQISLSEVIVKDNPGRNRNKVEPLGIEIIRNDFILQNNAGSLIKTIGKLPGVYSMDIGSGFSKPVIRGMGFNRVAVIEHSIKQEGQQWGADHGLELDQFNVGTIEVFKGPMSLQYGSDAIGGVVEILPIAQPETNKVYTDVTSLYKSNNNLLGISAMAGIKRNQWFVKARYTEQHFADYKIPEDTIIYLTRQMPVKSGRLKNTAGYERDIASTLGYNSGTLITILNFSKVYQKTGFFPGSHGIPDLDRVIDDGNARNIEYPLSNVDHLKLISNTIIKLHSWDLKADLAFQNNHRQEWAIFHTHYGNQLPPLQHPNLELDFNITTLTGNLRIESAGEKRWKQTFGFSSDYQVNDIKGYNFLLPEFNRLTTGMFALEQFSLSDALKVIGGVRFDLGNISIAAFRDIILEEYLRQLNLYSASEIDFYSNRSKELNRWFTNFSGSFGCIFTIAKNNTLKANVGKSFRLPGANELSSNGVHHGTFRHELGDTSLKSEVGYQLDISYISDIARFYLSVNPFLSWFRNYIYLEPSGEWSVLPHAGQIYNYKQAKAFIGGGEISARYEVMSGFIMESGFEYVFMQNLTDGYPLPFSPPASILSGMSWQPVNLRVADIELRLEHRYTASQKRIARNEEVTSSYHLVDLIANTSFILNKSKFEILLQVHNILNTKYFNHLSYYRKLNIPESGRNFQVTLRYLFY